MAEKQKYYKEKPWQPAVFPKNYAEMGKLPPSAVDLEQLVLGAILLEQEVLLVILKILRTEMFYKEEHQRIFHSIQSLSNKSQPIDIATVVNELKLSGELDLVGGAYAITQLTNNVASSAHTEFHARIIIQKYIQRELIRTSTEIVKGAYDDTTDVFDLLEQAQKNFDEFVLSSISITSKIKYYTVDNLHTDLSNLSELGIQRGHEVGFNCLKDYYSIKLGSTTYCMGSPSHGKSEFWLEVLINTSIKSGWKHVLYTPETGNKEEIIAELCYKYIGKPFYKTTQGCMSDEERAIGLQWIGKHFFVVDPEDEPMTISDFFEIVDKIEKEQGKIHTTTIDPFNEIAHDFRNDEGRQDLYIERVLGNIRKNAQKYKRHNCVITHCRDQPPQIEDGITYFAKPTARDYAGGQAWFRKGNSMLGFWRPPFGLKDKSGDPYSDNELHLLIQKAKPKGTGKKGEVKLFFNAYKNKYFELIDGREVYAWESSHIVNDLPEQNNSALAPNKDFSKENRGNHEYDENPF